MVYGKLDAREIKRTEGRRNALKMAGLSLGAGAVVTAGSYVGLGMLGEKAKDYFVGIEEEVRELAHDISILSGSLERELAKETSELKEQYVDGRLRIYEELGLADPAELAEFEQIIANSEEFEAHYNFVERSKIFKDRINRKLLVADNKLESYQPDALKSINDGIRKLLGKKSGDEGMKERGQIKGRLDSLVRIYDANENNRIAEVEVMDRLNGYLRSSKLSSEERALYGFLRDEYGKSGNEEDLRHFVQNYDKFKDRNDVLLKLRDSLGRAELLYGNIQDNKEYLSELQGLLKEGIELKQNVRVKTHQEFSVLEDEVNKKISELRGSVDDIIHDLESKGYDIETRDEVIDAGSPSKYDKLIDNVVGIGAGVLGVYSGVKTFFGMNKRHKVNTLERSLESAVRSNNGLVDMLNESEVNTSDDEESIEKDLNPDNPEYMGDNEYF
ncbi:hypothetical protein CMI38_02550 [Candidatus Pacearchaeota archaeon]|jgi:hypothetical protein|nr:hypothetical protein [Candidatus Pacearchaeota archaeon]|tara:strand:+ start:12292 stop:13623 length:1332 start_codon:yes stop_codon:yes gene_type:complete